MPPRSWSLGALFAWLLVVTSAALSLRGEGGSGSEPLRSFDHLKSSVLRFTVYRKIFHWSRPFDRLASRGNLGSGFLVSVNPPTICTCAHVVVDANEVYVQVTEFGKTKFKSRVATINNDADIALVVLEDPEAFMLTLKGAGLTLEPLKLADRTPPLGHAVVAPGFPLGQRTMTLSTGVISGVDHVSFRYTNLALQSTAIISSGNSGSPLLDAETQEVIGMNYAKNRGEAQINYAVPLWKLRQAFAKHEESHGSSSVTNAYQFKMTRHGLVLTPGYDALYMRSEGGEGCNSGPLISAIRETSPFKDADPPIAQDSFLLSIDGVTLDRYGQGMKSEYVQELVDFNDLMWMRPGTGEQEIEFETCATMTGERRKHKMSMAWRQDRSGQGVQYIYEPRRAKVDYEIFGELLFMDLTENHIDLLKADSQGGSLRRYLDPGMRHQPRLAVLLMKAGGEAEEALGLHQGRHLAVVDTVNGHAVNNLEELRRHFVPSALGDESGEKAQEVEEATTAAAPNTTMEAESEGAQSKDTEAEGSKDSEEEASHEAAATSAMVAVAGRLEKKSGAGGTMSLKRKGRKDGEAGMLWSLKTVAGREYAAFFADTLQKQAARRGAAHLLTPAVQDAVLRLGLLPKTKLVALLAEGRGAAPEEADSVEETPDTEQLGEPLEASIRDEGVAMLDFAEGERPDEW